MSDRPVTQRNLQFAEVKTRNKIRTQLADTIAKGLRFSLTMTFAVIFCHGFSLWGFHLSESFLAWLGGATIGQIGTLFAMAWRQK